MQMPHPSLLCDGPMRCGLLRAAALPAQAQEFGKVLVPLFKQLAKCLNSSHFQVRSSCWHPWQ